MDERASHPSAIYTVLRQCNDLLAIYDDLCSKLYHQLQQKEEQDRGHVSWEDYQTVYRELEVERTEHARTHAALMSERERVQCCEAEVEVMRKQLEREKSTFEKAFGILSSKAVIDSSKSEELIAKVTGLEALCKQKEEEIAAKDKSIKDLRAKLACTRDSHKSDLHEMKIQMQQELYMAKNEVLTGMQTNSSNNRRRRRKP